MNDVIQSDKFLNGAADDYYRRNKADFGKADLVTPLFEKVGLHPKRVLEIGCANGWRLERLREKYDCMVCGLDPSYDAVMEAKVPVTLGTADDLSSFDTLNFDTVIVGFCMWLIEPHQWFKVVAETDRVLLNGGALIIHDYAVPYPMRWEGWADEFGGEHEKDTAAWFYDFPRLWLGHPCYGKIAHEVAAKRFGEMFMLEQATLLRKSYTAFLGVKPNAVV